jgi:hypothetical protein
MNRIVAAAVGLLVLLASPVAAGTKMTVYKDPNCGCCAAWAQIMAREGFAVQVKDTDKLDAMRRMAGVPERFAGCHMAMVDGYVVEGHVPAAIVKKLVTEQPAIKGVSLPGMPAGSPGMGGAKEAPFQVLAIEDGEPRIFATE